jgi:photosystem II stability/assembly factor-like uncharacterized protein
MDAMSRKRRDPHRAPGPMGRQVASSSRSRAPTPHAGSGPRRWPLISLASVVVGVTVLLVAMWFIRGQGGQSGQTSWTRFGTADVHSLAFVDDDPQHLLFGHHHGLLETTDGGRNWRPLATRADAMEMGAAGSGSIVIAGHDVFTASADGGATWKDIPAGLPSLDIHGFTRDPGDPARMWAYPTSGGFWESRDGGSHWEQVYADNILFPVATTQNGQTVLYGVDISGLASSADGGRSWTPLTTPPAYPFTSFTATADGSVLLVGSLDGLFRSDDGGRAWSKLPFVGSAFAIGVTSDGRDIAVVTKETEFFRSRDGGQTWPGPR